MDYRYIKLGDCLSLITNGFVVKQSRDTDKAGGYPFTRIETLSNGRFNRDRMGYADIYDLKGLESYVLEDEDIIISHINSRRFLGRSVLYKKIGDEIILHGMNVLRIKTNRDVLNPVYANYFFQTEYYKQCIDNIRKDAINQSSFSIGDFQKLVIPLPEIEYQEKIADVLSSLDRKIALNRAINRNLEALAKQLYDYWFVQFDFPDENGKPYKSSGGKMVWNEDIQMSIPYGWNVCRLSDFIGKNNTGDWGTDEPSGNSIEIGCIRGADILSLNDLPKRYIKSNKVEKLLTEWDVVIEVSGGSPVQATGRSAYITPGVIERNGGNISCSNFCHAFSFKDYRDSAYFFYVWNMFYDNGIMFNYEGKTSGIKNFMTDVFLANKWINAPKTLIVKFYNVIKEIYAKMDANISENNSLTKQRDELLPLLMNGQVTIE